VVKTIPKAIRQVVQNLLSDSAGAAAGAAAVGKPKPSGNGEGVCTGDDPYGDGRKPPENPAHYLKRPRGQPKKD